MEDKKCYQIKETCPIFDKEYERLLPTIFLDRDEAEKYKDDLEFITAERVTCAEYEIIEFNLCENYDKEKGNILTYHDYILLHDNL